MDDDEFEAALQNAGGDCLNIIREAERRDLSQDAIDRIESAVLVMVQFWQVIRDETREPSEAQQGLIPIPDGIEQLEALPKVTEE